MLGEHPLIGREREFRALEAAVDDALRGRQVVVALRGAPGIGKTRLLTELGCLATARGLRVLAGRAAEFEPELPFAPFVRALGSGEALTGAPDVPAATIERHRVHRQAAALLRRAASDGGLLLALDDLHWADAASLELLAHLVRHPPQAPIVLAVAYQPEQAPARLLSALGEAKPGVTTIDLAPLTKDDVAALVDAADADRLHEQSGGNPLLLRTLAKGGTVDDALTGLPRVSMRVAHAIAVGGDGSEPALLAHLAQLPVPHVLAGLDDLVQRDLVVQDGSPYGFAFRHPLLRRAAYEAAGTVWAAAAHRRADQWLRLRGASPVSRAPHIERHAESGDLDSAATLVEAAQLALPSAPASAARWIESALALLHTEDETEDEHASLRHQLAVAYFAQGRLDDGRTLLRSLLPELDGTCRAQALSLCVAIDQLLGDHESARGTLRAELAVAAPRQRPRILLHLATACQDAGKTGTARLWAEQALAEAGDRRVFAAGAHALLAVMESRRAQREHVARCVELLDATPDEELAEALEVAIRAAQAELLVNRFADVTRHAARALPIARATGQVGLVHGLLCVLATGKFQTGPLADAQAFAADALEVAELVGGPRRALVAS